MSVFIVQAQCFFLFTRMPDETSAKKVLTAPSLENWRIPPGRPEDYPALRRNYKT